MNDKPAYCPVTKKNDHNPALAMNEHSLRLILEGTTRSATASALRLALWLPGRLYGFAMRARRAAYKHRLFTSEKAPIPVISVGNITAGGSGKTPFAVMLAKWLLQQGRTPAILLRGYARERGDPSDEAALYRTACPEAIVVVNPDRRAGARTAKERGADAAIMDDGFQHLRLRRDLDIVLIDAAAPWGGGNTIPGGLLREPKSALKNARAVVVTRSDQVAPETVAALRGEIAALAPSAIILQARHAPARLLDLDGGELPLADLSGRPVVALSGIARPEAFHCTLRQLGANVIATISGRDHEQFSRATLDAALDAARQGGAVVAITEKDRGKKIFNLFSNDSADNMNGRERVRVLTVEQEVDDPAALFALIKETIA